MKKNFRIIPKLEIKNQNLIKGIRMDGLRVIGDPNQFGMDYYNSGADELIYMDIVASLYGRNNLSHLITKLAKEVFIPITVGGGIRKETDIYNVLRCGADKVSINTAAVENPSFIKNMSKVFGSSTIVLSIEAKKKDEKKWEVYTKSGREKTGIDVVEWIKKMQDFNVGEIMLASVDRDGTNKGLDIDLINEVKDICKVPLVLGGGFNLDDITNKKELKYLDGLCISSLLHYKKTEIKSIKKKLKSKNFLIR